MTINSGILYLEKFIEDSNLLPSDLGRLLNFIKALDERLQGVCSPRRDRPCTDRRRTRASHREEYCQSGDVCEARMCNLATRCNALAMPG